jgi:hypothetical protein
MTAGWVTTRLFVTKPLARNSATKSDNSRVPTAEQLQML